MTRVRTAKKEVPARSQPRIPEPKSIGSPAISGCTEAVFTGNSGASVGVEGVIRVLLGAIALPSKLLWLCNALANKIPIEFHIQLGQGCVQKFTPTPRFEIGYTQLQTGFLDFFWPLYCHTVCSVLCSPIPHRHA